MINASLFNAAIPAIIILLCFLFKIEKTNKFQILGLIISVGGILAIVTKLKLDILLSLNFNKGDLIMIGGVLSWGIYSTLLKKKKFTLPLLTLVHIICTFGLITVFPQYLYELSNGLAIKFDSNLIYTLLFLALFPSIGLTIVGQVLFLLLEQIEQASFYPVSYTHLTLPTICSV